MTLAEYCTRVMSEKKLIPAEVARRSQGSLTASYVSKIMRGEVQNPSIPKLKALARAIGVEENAVLRVAGVEFDKENPWPADTIVLMLQKIVSDPDLGELVKVAMNKKPEQIRAAIRALKR
jgi:transcriptional regulator with XRE-family HTH domain